MKKTIIVFLVMTLALSAFASAGWLEFLFGQNRVTGAQVYPQSANVATVGSTVATFKGIVFPSTVLKHDTITNLPNGVTAKSTYNSATKTATVTFTSKLTVTNNQKVKFDDGTWTASVSSRLISPGGVTFSRGATGITNRPQPQPPTNQLTGAATTGITNKPKSLRITLNTGKNVPLFLQFGKPKELPNGFTATANKNADGTVTVTFSKTVGLTNNEKVSIADGIWTVYVTKEGFSFKRGASGPSGPVGGASDAMEVGGECAADVDCSIEELFNTSCRLGKCVVTSANLAWRCTNLTNGKGAELTRYVNNVHYEDVTNASGFFEDVPVYEQRAIKKTLTNTCFNEGNALVYSCSRTTGLVEREVRCRAGLVCAGFGRCTSPPGIAKSDAVTRPVIPAIL